MSGPNHQGFTPQTPPGYGPQAAPPYPPPGHAAPGAPKGSGALKIVVWVVAVMLFLFVGFIALGTVAFVFVADKPDKARWQKAKLEMGELAKALDAYKLEHGEYPSRIDDLASDFGGRLPNDPFSKAPYDYTRTATGFRIVCLGKDQAVGGAEIPDRDITCDETGFHGTP